MNGGGLLPDSPQSWGNGAEARVARAALSRLMEPSDVAGLALVEAVGPVEALALVRSGWPVPPGVRQSVAGILDAYGSGQPERQLPEALKRWAPRLPDLAPERDIATVRRFGGFLLTPEDRLWPEALADLQLNSPLCLWVRSGNPLAVLPAARSVAVVGSRDATAYGVSVAGDLASGLVGRGCSVISGGAYGIDAQAHRSALAAAGTEAELPTVAVLAGGVDRYYPAGNEDLLRAVADSGAVIAEVPPGSAPTRWRFLQRNRLIAALAGATVVVEARWRSGALSTAHHAAALGRGLGAVPGSVYSANSAGCHRLLRDAAAVCVTDAAEVLELVGGISGGPAAEPETPDLAHDGLTVPDLLLLDALPVRSGSSVEKLTSVAGLGVGAVLAGLSRLELAGLARQDASGWRRKTPPHN